MDVTEAALRKLILDAFGVTEEQVTAIGETEFAKELARERKRTQEVLDHLRSNWLIYLRSKYADMGITISLEDAVPPSEKK